MINKKKCLAIVIFLSIFACFLLGAALVILLGLSGLSLANLFAAALTSGYLMIVLKRRREFRDNPRRIKIPFILFGILIIPVIATLSISIIYSYDIYLVIISL